MAERWLAKALGLIWIDLPAPSSFSNRQAFVSNLVHGQILATAHRSSLHRPHFGSMGSESYGRELVVAELGAFILCQRLQIGPDFQGHAAYLVHWAQLLKEQPSVHDQVLRSAWQSPDPITLVQVEPHSFCIDCFMNGNTERFNQGPAPPWQRGGLLGL
ncbi:MAG: zincin-like metallopeptidase domain-containing protein [Synechococcaceae cyanobacterium ELA739]